jgi:hypothetical protein
VLGETRGKGVEEEEDKKKRSGRTDEQKTRRHGSSKQERLQRRDCEWWVGMLEINPAAERARKRVLAEPASVNNNNSKKILKVKSRVGFWPAESADPAQQDNQFYCAFFHAGPGQWRTSTPRRCWRPLAKDQDQIHGCDLVCSCGPSCCANNIRT